MLQVDTIEKEATAIGARNTVRLMRSQIGLTERDLADATGASTRTVRRWTKAARTNQMAVRMRPETERHLDDLRSIVDLLKTTMDDQGVKDWLHARNYYLDHRRPIDVLRQGDYGLVHEAADALVEGYYL